MKRLIMAASVTAAALTVTALWPLLRGGTGATAQRSPAAPRAAPAVERVIRSVPVPALTKAEEARAREILAADPHFQQLVAGRHYTIADAGAWHTEKGSRKIGAALRVTLPAPVAAEIDWPVMDYDETEASWPPYHARTLRFAAAGITELMVSIDLARGVVVSIMPEQGATVTPPPGMRPVEPPGAGLR